MKYEFDPLLEGLTAVTVLFVYAIVLILGREIVAELMQWGWIN